jgi:hypothetical protein
MPQSKFTYRNILRGKVLRKLIALLCLGVTTSISFSQPAIATTSSQSFVGVIEAHSTYDPWDFTVNGQVLELDLIAPLTGSCFDLHDAIATEAYRLEQELLPIGREVNVVMSGDGNKAFIHLLDADGQLIWPAPSQSANEILVQTGYWVPAGFGIDSGPDYNDYQLSFDNFTTIENQYLPYILNAGNLAAEQLVGANGPCLGSTFEYDFSIAVSIAISARESNSDSGGWTYCRDGDGDGFCGE